LLVRGEIDRRAIEALGSTLAGSDRPLIVTSGTALLTPGRLAIEDIVPTLDSHPFPRVASEVAAASMAARGGCVSVVRLPPSVHGDGDHGFVPRLAGIARDKGVSAYVGHGLNRWPAVHRIDAAHLYRLALEKGSGGARYHGVADEAVPFRDIAEVIGRRLDVPIVSKSPEDAAEHFGFLGYFVGVDCPASSAQTQERLGWRPTQPGLISDIDRPSYFKGDSKYNYGA
jgi:nucleoside-diphosphate-sugar epimerase